MRTTVGRSHRTGPRDGGFTLIEVLVTIVIAGILMAIAVGGWRAYAASQAQRGTADALVSLMREAQQRAVTEGTTYGVQLSPTGPWVLRQLVPPYTDCTAGTAKSSEVPSRGGIAIAGPSCVLFQPRGTATAATIKVQRAGTSKLYTIKVEGLAGRASLS